MEIYVAMKNVETFDSCKQECDGTVAIGAFKTIELAKAYTRRYVLDEYANLNSAHPKEEIMLNEPKKGFVIFEIEWNNKDGHAFRKYSWWIQAAALSEDTVIPKVCNAHNGISCGYAVFDSIIDHNRCTYAKECPFAEEMGINVRTKRED